VNRNLLYHVALVKEQGSADTSLQDLPFRGLGGDEPKELDWAGDDFRWSKALKYQERKVFDAFRRGKRLKFGSAPPILGIARSKTALGPIAPG
jgi:hypothetical protein